MNTPYMRPPTAIWLGIAMTKCIFTMKCPSWGSAAFWSMAPGWSQRRARICWFTETRQREGLQILHSALGSRGLPVDLPLLIWETRLLLVWLRGEPRMWQTGKRSGSLCSHALLHISTGSAAALCLGWQFPLIPWGRTQDAACMVPLPSSSSHSCAAPHSSQLKQQSSNIQSF